MNIPIHLENEFGGARCPTKAIDVLVSAVPADVTCSYCRRYLKRYKSPAELAAVKRRGGKVSAKLPECNIKFARIL